MLRREIRGRCEVPWDFGQHGAYRLLETMLSWHEGCPLEGMSAARLDDLRRSMVEDLRRETSSSSVIETHISWVLLGREVYKLKKPVKLPFVDFSSPEEREKACRTEARINRRLAPTTYLGVVPIRRRSDGRFTFEGETGPVVEWAVHMKRLDDAGRADVLLAQNALSRAHVDALGTAIAEFHLAAARDEAGEFGAPAVIERNVEDNLQSLRRAQGEDVGEQTVKAIAHAQRTFVHERRDLLERRAREGFVREGHGDLRLEHVFYQGAPDTIEVIDAVEFAEVYRFGDVASDVAFLAMDLARLGRVDLAERFVAQYARASGDYELYRLVDFYASYRACVRAKIACLQASEAAIAEARRYLALADAEQRRSLLAPILVVVAGGIATGKTTLAERFGEELGAPVIEADRTRKQMLGLSPTAHPSGGGAWQGNYDPEFSKLVYRELLDRADAVLASGRPVVVDASFRTKAARSAARELATMRGVPFHLFECVVPIEVARARLRARDPRTTASDATTSVLDAFTKGYEAITELPANEHTKLDTGTSATDALERALKEVPTWPRGLVR